MMKCAMRVVHSGLFLF